MSEPVKITETSAPETPEAPRQVYTPAIDIYETSQGLVLEADLPGVQPQHLEIRVEDNVLHLYGKVTWPVTTGARLLHEEVREEDFYRSFILSDEVETEQITADFSDGILKLTLPKAPKAKPRKIEVRTNK